MTMACCATCKKWLGQTRSHADGICPVQASFWCSQCGCHGHRPAECDAVKHVDRPCYLEDLIPSDVRERWDIDTQTPIAWLRPSLDDCEREIADLNTIEIRYPDGKQDSRIRETMRRLGVPTVHKMEGNLQKLRAWAVQNGKKVRLVQER